MSEGPYEIARCQEYVIPAENLAVLREHLIQLNKRAVRLGAPEISLHCLGEESHTDKQGLMRVYTRIQVTGARPRIAGYLLVGWCEYFFATPEGQAACLQHRTRMPSLDGQAAQPQESPKLLLRPEGVPGESSVLSGEDEEIASTSSFVQNGITLPASSEERGDRHASS